ncbi:MAG: MATE family multidrug resistance protein [Verrucomicrobiales bacterium]|jgi:MATE family multidrug resistance protein
MSRPDQAQFSVLALAIPSMLTYVAFAIRQFTDALMVGRLGMTEPLAAIMPAQQVMFVILSFGSGLAAALNTVASQALAKNDTKEAGLLCWQSVWIALIAGTIMTQLFWFAPNLMGLFGHQQVVYAYEVAYFEIAIWAIIPQFISLALSNFFFAIQRPKISMWIGIGYVVINIIANRIFIFGWGFEGLGMVGAAWGTIIAASFQMVALFVVFIFDPSIKPYLRWPSFAVDRIRRLLRIGPYNAGIDVVDILFWNIGIVFFVGQFGTTHLAAAAVMVSILDLVVFPVHGVFVALTSVVGRYAAAGRHEDAFREVRHTVIVSVCVTALLGIVLWLCSPLIYEFVSGDPDVARIGQRCMAMLPLILGFSAWFYVVDGALNGAGDARFPFIVLLISNFLIIGGGGYLCLIYYGDLGSFVIWVCVMVNRGVIAVIASARWKSGAWKNLPPFDLAESK